MKKIISLSQGYVDWDSNVPIVSNNNCLPPSVDCFEEVNVSLAACPTVTRSGDIERLRLGVFRGSSNKDKTQAIVKFLFENGAHIVLGTAEGLNPLGDVSKISKALRCDVLVSGLDVVDNKMVLPLGSFFVAARPDLVKLEADPILGGLGECQLLFTAKKKNGSNKISYGVPVVLEARQTPKGKKRARNTTEYPSRSINLCIENNRPVLKVPFEYNGCIKACLVGRIGDPNHTYNFSRSLLSEDPLLDRPVIVARIAEKFSKKQKPQSSACILM